MRVVDAIGIVQHGKGQAGRTPSGGSLPTASQLGDLFIFKPTGRAWLVKWDGTAWLGQLSFGATTLFVDIASGTDSIEKGTGTGSAAYATLQYAINQLPGMLNGNVTINVAGNTESSPRIYREAVTIQGKTFTGAFALTITGGTETRVAAKIGTLSAANGAGNGADGFGTLTDAGAAWTVNEHRERFVEITSGTGAGQVRAIHSNTATQLTIVGRWDIVPTSGSDFKIFALAARITGANAGAETTPVRQFAVKLVGQKSVVLDRLKIDYAGLDFTDDNRACVLVNEQSSCTAQYCWLQGSLSLGNMIGSGSSIVLVSDCVIRDGAYAGLRFTTNTYVTDVRRCRIRDCTSYGVDSSGGAVFGVRDCHINPTANGASALTVNAGFLQVLDYTEMEGVAGTTGSNILAFWNGVVQLFGPNGDNTKIVSNKSGAWGVEARTGAHVDGASGITYTGTHTSGQRTPTTAAAGSTN